MRRGTYEHIYIFLFHETMFHITVVYMAAAFFKKAASIAIIAILGQKNIILAVK